MIEYAQEKEISVTEFIDILKHSTLGERRPITAVDRVEKMLAYANLIITARHNGRLVGVARSLTDFGFCTYLSDLAVDELYQHKGIGRELIRQTKIASPQARLILLAAPKSINYYARIGFSECHNAFSLEDVKSLR